jgi:hypothetical protein
MSADLEEIRERADAVLTAMADDCGPISAEPYATWASQEAQDVITLLDLLAEIEQKASVNVAGSAFDEISALARGAASR